MTISHPSTPATLPRTFDGLSDLRQMRFIRDAADYEHALRIFDRLIAEREKSKEQSAYLCTLAVLVAAYEEDHDPLKQLPPHEVLRELCRRKRMSASDLGRLLGNRSLGSKLLVGEREPSKSQIRILCRHFLVRADLFL